MSFDPANLRRGFGRAALHALLALGVSAAAMTAATMAYAQTAPARRHAIPAGPLATVLNQYALESGLTLTYPPELVSGLNSPGLKGSYAPLDGLAVLLDGSGIAVRQTGPNAATLVAAEITPAATPAEPSPAATRDGDETVVVVGQLTDAAVTYDTIEVTQARDLRDIFRQVPSVSVGGSVGIAQKVFIRGVEDTLLNITVDGAPQTGTLFHHIGRVSVEPELLKRVEVQSGAGEATAGFGAIGGAIRFRTRDAHDLLAEGERFGGIARAGYFSNEGYRLSLTGYGELDDTWSVLGTYVYVDRETTVDGDGSPLRGTAAEQSLAFVKLTGNLSETQSLSLSYERREEEGAFAQRPNWPALATDPLFPAEALRDTAVANYRLNQSDALNLEITAYWTNSRFVQDRYDRWGRYSGDMETFGVDLRNTSHVGDHKLVYGIEYRNDAVEGRYLEDQSIWGDWAWDPAIGVFEEEGEALAFYAQDHWQATDALLVSFGVRYDSYDLTQITYNNGTSSDGFSFNIGAEYLLAEHLTLSAGFAEAMRGKEVGDAFTLEHRPGRISIAPDLQPEEVDNYELGLAYDDGTIRASIAYFDMTIDNVILDQLGSGPAPQAAEYYENVGAFTSTGIELKLGATWNGFSADLAYNTYDAELNGHTVEGYEELGLGNASGDRWVLNLSYAPNAHFEFGGHVTRVEDLNDITVLYRAVEIGWIADLQEVDKPGYTVVDLYAQWKPYGDDKVTVNLAVQNLFDVLYRDHASVADYAHIPDWEGVVGVYEPGRDVRLSVGMRF